MKLLDALLRAPRRYLPPGSGVLFPPGVRRRYVLVLLGSCVLAALELLGLGALLVLAQQLTGAGTARGPVVWLWEAMGFPSQKVMVVLLAGQVLVVFFAKAAFGLFFRRRLLYFTAHQEVDTAHRLLVGYLQGPYWKVARRNTGDLVARMYDYTTSLYSNVVGGMIGLAVESLTVLVIMLFVLVQMPVPTLGALLFFLLGFIVLNRVIKPRSGRLGGVLRDSGASAFRATLQSLAGLKEIRVRQTQDRFIDDYVVARRRWASAKADSAFLGELPRYVLEVMFVIGVLVVVALVSLTSDTGDTLPLVALFIAAGFRLLPSVNRIIGSVTAIRIGLPQMEAVVEDLLDDLRVADAYLARPAGTATSRRLPLRRSLNIEDVHFRYPDTDRDVIDGVSLSIAFGQSVAFVGASGAGKTTLIDLIIGLHEPRQGRILVDGSPFEADVAAWQRSIGLVPQDVFIMDATLRANIALGLDLAADDGGERMTSAIRRSQLSDVVAELPDGVETVLGDRGSSVSGGQRQRIGIARALYTDPTLLVLDEATSALDNETEHRVTETIARLRGTVTTIVVAHRLSTVRHCDRVVFLERGRVAAHGTFEEVATANAAFAEMVALGRL